MEAEVLDVAAAAADAVFLARVSSIRDSESMPTSAGVDVDLAVFERVARLEVLGSWKEGVGDEVEVRTGVSDADCGFPFEVGKTYLVFAHRGSAGLAVSLCSRTQLVERAVEDLLELGPPTYSMVEAPDLFGTQHHR